MNGELLDPRGVSEYSNGVITETQLGNWRARGQGPAFVKAGGRIGYQRSDIDSWLAANRTPENPVNKQAQLFAERQAHWIGQGLSGRAVYEKLAVDPALPLHYSDVDLAAISGLSAHALRQRRSRTQEPPFMRLSVRCVRYPRAAAILWLADMYHERRA